jgi:hypothetical protein
MRRAFAWCVLSVLGATVALADETPKQDVKEMSGISILGNQEAPKSLVIVPWKSSEIGAGIGLSNSPDGRPVPVDRDVFARQLSYYEIRTRGTR